MLKCYKTIHDLNGLNCNDYFEFNCYGKTRSNHSFKLRQPLARRVNCLLHSFFVRTIEQWNALPKEIVDEQDSGFFAVNFESIVKFCNFFSHFLIFRKFYVVVYQVIGS